MLASGVTGVGFIARVEATLEPIVELKRREKLFWPIRNENWGSEIRAPRSCAVYSAGRVFLNWDAFLVFQVVLPDALNSSQT